MEFQLFQIVKDDAVKVLHSICQQIWETQQWPQDWKRSVFIPIPKKGNAKECSNYCTIALTSHASKVMLKILQARLQLQINRELPDIQVGFREGRETRDQIANICCWIIEKASKFQKNFYFCFYFFLIYSTSGTLVNANVSMLDVVLKFLNLFSFFNTCFSFCYSNWVISSILSSRLFMYFSVSLKLLLISSSVLFHFSFCIHQL